MAVFVGFTEFYRVFPSFHPNSKYGKVFNDRFRRYLGFTEFYRVFLWFHPVTIYGSTVKLKFIFFWYFFLVLLSLTEFYRVLSSFNALFPYHYVSLSFDYFNKHGITQSFRFYRLILLFFGSFTGFYWLLLGFTRFYWIVVCFPVSLGFTWFIQSLIDSCKSDRNMFKYHKI